MRILAMFFSFRSEIIPISDSQLSPVKDDTIIVV